jgi:hypothetical protein
MKLTLLFLLLIGITGYGISQQNQSNNLEILEGFDGTFQIEIHNVRHQPNIPGNLFEIVSQNRLENQTNYFPLYENIRIRIPFKNEFLDYSLSIKKIINLKV